MKALIAKLKMPPRSSKYKKLDEVQPLDLEEDELDPELDEGEEENPLASFPDDLLLAELKRRGLLAAEDASAEDVSAENALDT